MSGVTLLLPIYAFMRWTGAIVHFTFFTSWILNIVLRKVIIQIKKFAKYYFSGIRLVSVPLAKYTLKTHILRLESQIRSQLLWTVRSPNIFRDRLDQKR